jgi:hypothetical protein
VLDIKFEQIKNNAEKIINVNTYKEFKEKLGVEKLNDFLKKFSKGLYEYDLINNNLNQILVPGSYDFVKILLRNLLLAALTDKDFDIENLFYPDETFYNQNVKDVVPHQMQKPFKMILVKLRDNLQKTINLLPE